MQTSKSHKPKRLLSLVLTLCMVLTLVPFTASAATPITTKLDFTAMSTTDNLASQGWAWNNTSKTLTLNGLDLTCDWSGTEAILLPVNSIVILIGVNSIKHIDDGHGIYCDGDLTIQGSGTLNIDAPKNGIWVDGDLSINGGSGIIKGDIMAVCADGTIILSGIAVMGNTGSGYNITTHIAKPSAYSTFFATGDTSTPLKDIQFMLDTSPAIFISSTGLDGLKVGQSVSGSIIYTLSNGTYAASITPANFSVSGLPAGLTAGTAIRTNGTVVTVPITGSPTTPNPSPTIVTLPSSIPQANVSGATTAITPTGTVTASMVAGAGDVLSPITGKLDFTGSHATNPGNLATLGWAWNSGTRTLTLSGLDLTCDLSGQEAILLPNNSTIILIGANNIKHIDGGYGILCSGNLTLQGSGALNIDAPNIGIWVDSDLTINSGTGTIKGDNMAVRADGTIMLSGVTVMGNTGGGYNIAAQVASPSGWATFVATSAPSTPLKNIQFAPTAPTLGGTLTIDLNTTNGTITANTSAVTGGSGAFTYSWSGTGVTNANATTRTNAQYSRGQEVTLTLTRADATGSLTATITVYQASVTLSGNTGADTASIAASYGKAGDIVSIAYTLGSTGSLSNTLTYTGPVTPPVTVSTPGTSTSSYTIVATDANASGVVPITATFAHSDLPAISGSVSIDLNTTNGMLTANTSAVGGSGAFTYAWSGTGVTNADAATRTNAQYSRGQQVTLTVSRAGYSGTLTANITVYQVGSGATVQNGSTGTFSITSVYGKVGDTVTCTYSAGDSSGVSFASGGTGAVALTSGNTVYTIVASHAVSGVITITATFTAPALGGTASISGTNAIGQLLTVSTASITGGSGAFSYQWQAGGSNVGTNSTTYTLTGADAGKAITCIVTRAGTTGSVTASFDSGNTVPFNIAVTNTGNIAGDTVVTLSAATGRVGNTITLNYVLGNGGGAPIVTNNLNFTGATGLTNLATAGASTTQGYTVNAADAVSGVITITATFVHSASTAQTLTFALGNQTKTFGDAGFTNAVTSDKPSTGTISYVSSNPSVATVTNLGVVAIVGAGTTTITADITDDGTFAAATASYTITVGNASQAAPTGLGKTDETVALNDGTITGVSTAMEYKLSTDATYIAITGTTVTGLAPGTYNVRYAAKANYNAGATANVTIAAYSAPPTTYAVTVSGSYAGTTGAGSYAPSATVTINAGTRTNYTFSGWTTSSAGVTFANASSATTTFPMPSNAVTVTANWTYNGGGGGGTPTTYYTVTFDLNGGTRTGGGALSQSVASGGSATAPTVTRDKYTFDGWDKSFSNVTSNITVKAQWKPVDGAVTLPDGITIDTPAGKDPVVGDDGKITLPGGGTITTDDGTKIVVPPGTIITPDGKISFPKGSGGGKVTHESGHSFDIIEDAVIILDDDVPLGYFVSITNPFADIKTSDWFFDYVIFAYTHGLMVGTSTDPMMFSPNVTTTRGMVVTVLYRMAGSPDVSGLKNPFDDVPAGTWYTDAVIWAANKGIVAGYGNGKFGPNDNITREQLATMLNNYAVKMGLKLPVTREYTGFKDDADIANYAKDAIERFFKAGIISGKPGNVFDPKGDATRAEFATMLMGFLGTMEKE